MPPPPYCNMTQSIPYKKTIVYKAKKIMERPGFVYEYYETKTSTNWFYEAAEKFLHEQQKAHKQKKSYEQQKSRTTPQEIFAFFGCPYPCNENQLKTAYLEMIKQYHPDKVNGMGPEIKELAEKKTKEINDMYEKALSYMKR
jgi:preprotein translocase subunit Sec63